MQLSLFLSTWTIFTSQNSLFRASIALFLRFKFFHRAFCPSNLLLAVTLIFFNRYSHLVRIFGSCCNYIARVFVIC